MKFGITAIVAAVSLGGAAYAAEAPADRRAYVGGVYSFVDYKESGLPALKPKAVALQVGWQYNRNLAFEARLGTGAGSDDYLGVDVKVDSYFSALVRGVAPVSDSFNVYAVAGVTNGKLKASGYGVTASSSESKASYAVGAELLFAKRSGIAVEWGRFLSGNGYTADALSLGYRYRF